MKHIIIAILITITSTILFADKKYYSEEAKYQKLSLDVAFRVNSPLILSDSIIFFFKGTAKTAVVAGDFNDWRAELLMQKEKTNFQKYVWNKRLKKGIYKYKLLIDDIWIADPHNTNRIIDEANQTLSYFELEEDFIPNRKYPLRKRKNKNIFIFSYTHPEVESVALVGSFNNWNPYSLPMKHIGAGEYTAEVELQPGFHTYCFVVDDEWIPDPNNLNQYSDEANNIISVLLIGEHKKKGWLWFK